jgi:hypothetical protein
MMKAARSSKMLVSNCNTTHFTAMKTSNTATETYFRSTVKAHTEHIKQVCNMATLNSAARCNIYTENMWIITRNNN